MQTKHTAALAATTIALAATVVATTRGAAEAKQLPPIRGTLSSDVWAGEMVKSTGGFTSVSADWTVPAVSCEQDESGATYAWVGLGGWDDDALEQVGTSQWCEDGTAYYGLFGEFYPSPPFAGDGGVYKPAVYPVRPGDKVSASVTRGARGAYTLTERNLTRGWVFRTTGRSPAYAPHLAADGAHGPGNDTAEVVMEGPADDLPRYGSTTFSAVEYAAASTRPISRYAIKTVLDNGDLIQTAQTSSTGVRTVWKQRD